MQTPAALPQRIAVITIYLSLNMSINLLNKYIISRTGFSFPLAISLAHMVFTIIVLLPVMLGDQYRALHTSTLRNNAVGLAVIGFSFSANLAFNNFSLTLLSLSLNQMIRACIPVVTVACSVLIERVMPTTRELLSLVAITAGMCVVLAEDVHVNAMGVFACTLSTVANGLMMSMSGAVLQEKLDVWRLSFYQAPIVVATLLPLYLHSEHDLVLEYLRTNASASMTMAMIALTCMIALGYNAVHGYAIKLTSATTTTVIGQGKILALLFLSAALLGERDFFELKTVIGGIIAMSGFMMYSLERTPVADRQKE